MRFMNLVLSFTSLGFFKWCTPYTKELCTFLRCSWNISFLQFGLKIRFRKGCIFAIFAWFFNIGDKGSPLFDNGWDSLNWFSVFIFSIWTFMWWLHWKSSSSQSETFSGDWVVGVLISSEFRVETSGFNLGDRTKRKWLKKKLNFYNTLQILDLKIVLFLCGEQETAFFVALPIYTIIGFHFGFLRLSYKGLAHGFMKGDTNPILL